MKKLSWSLSIVLIILTLILYFLKSPYWYNPAVIGVWLFFDNIAHLQKNKTTLDLIFNQKYKKFLCLYFALLILAVLIEVIGSLVLKLWSYPKLWAIEPLWLMLLINFVSYLFYPFILMSFKEMYVVIKSFIKNKYISCIIFMLLGIIIWEIPNIFSQDWIYNIPFISFEIFHINIIVIIGWIILIVAPLYVYKLVDKLIK
jgi:hypothetical protein